MKKTSPRGTTPRVRPAAEPRLSRAIIAGIRKNALFTNVPPRRVSALLPRLTLRHYDRGEVIFDESSSGSLIYLIITGRVRIIKRTRHGVESRLALLREGDFFGEMSIIDRAPRSARAEAMEDCDIVTLRSSDFRLLIRHSDAFSLNLLQGLARRLRTIDHTFVVELERNMRSLHERMDKLHLLVEASKIVNSSLDLDRLLELILEFATRSIQADRGTLYLLDGERQELWSKVAQGPSMIEIRMPVGKGLAGYVAKSGETVNIHDAYRDPRFNPEIDRRSGYHTHTVLCMPMRDREGVIVGVFQFLNKKGGLFTEEDQAFIAAFSIHAALAIQNARMARQMVDNERLSAVGKMANTIIHDIKNPMNTLRLYAQVIKSKTEGQEPARLAEEIMRQVDRFAHMAQDILDFSRGVSEMNLTEVKIGELMSEVLRFLELDLQRRKITLTHDLAYEGPARLDTEKMIRVFINLAGNAADAMPEGGTLHVTTGQAGGSLLIAFTDTGSGMTEEVRARIFEPFFTHGKKHGTGLGLSIVRKIVDDHGGTIAVASEPGRGTTFTVTLPLAIAPEPPQGA
jgi:signal transduction histidine kinase/CRP-like cAMP-binding protein